mmetsp:Transcript_4089/g.7850  ORF Transcript_4089/g.7850 Transcript_4089/m.7850 type:complete len:90 (+) Transcript_4089:4447-4716(+)
MEDNLRNNAKYVYSSTGSSSQSLCEVKCQEQQAALVGCMNSLRQQAEESNLSGVVTKDDDGMKNSCLSSSVAAWTECCSKANLHGEDTS